MAKNEEKKLIKIKKDDMKLKLTPGNTCAEPLTNIKPKRKRANANDNINGFKKKHKEAIL